MHHDFDEVFVMFSALLVIFATGSAPKVCDPGSHGASPSSPDNANAIQNALDECSGGGVVVLEGGSFKSGPLTVTGRDVELVIKSGATLETAYGPGAWPQADGEYADILAFRSCANCTLSGGGTLWGRGGRPNGPMGGDDWYYLFDEGKIRSKRPHYLSVSSCTAFTLRARDADGSGRLTILDAPMFNVVLKDVQGAEVDGLNITSTWYSVDPGGSLKEPHNTDGIDPGSGSTSIWIHDVHIDNGDDSIAVKPSTPCTRNILVERCTFVHGHGASIGSVGSGCVADVVFRNITMVAQEAGCRVKSYITAQRGSVTNVTWENIEMTNVNQCITVNADYKPAPKEPKAFVNVSGLRFINVRGTGCDGAAPAQFVCPAEAPCMGIELRNVQLSGKHGTNQCANAFGRATGAQSPPSCLEASPVPGPSPRPGPLPPVPTPPAPPVACDVAACFARCVRKYGGTIATAAYDCAKGCAGMSGGKVADEEKFCTFAAGAARFAACEAYCPHASGDAAKRAECSYGCAFWSAPGGSSARRPPSRNDVHASALAK